VHASARGGIESLEVTTYVIPTDGKESDGTFEWDKTTMVLVQARAGDEVGIGYTYANRATAELVREQLEDVVVGREVMDVPGAFARMVHQIRNVGRPGVASMAISAVDSALWDLKARVLGISLVALLGRERDGVPIYGSGGFTSYSETRLCEQLGGWVSEGIERVKMKVGRDPSADVARVRAVRRAIGDSARLFVDANGAYDRKQALAFAEQYHDLGVTWFEEPVSSDDLAGLSLVRHRAPAGMQVAAGEYGYDLFYFERMLGAQAVDTIQADMTRCGGVTGFREVGSLAHVHHVPLSGHCAPSLHAHVACAARDVVHLEYFHDHVRIEEMMFDGALTPRRGALVPDVTRPGNGLALKRSSAKRFAA
jgi:L-alanine-DL-glutamate epimerase-like enolase superfamily enzyme